MNPFLADLAEAFDDAFYDAFEANKANEGQVSPAEYHALYAAAQAARVLLEQLGFVEPFECGECDACQANAAARAAEMHEALTNDPAFVEHHGRPLSATEEETSARLLGDVFGTDGEPDATT